MYVRIPGTALRVDVHVASIVSDRRMLGRFNREDAEDISEDRYSIDDNKVSVSSLFIRVDYEK